MHTAGATYRLWAGNGKLAQRVLRRLEGVSCLSAAGVRFAGRKRRCLVESGPSVLEAGPQETGRTVIPDASAFCIAGSRGLLPFIG